MSQPLIIHCGYHKCLTVYFYRVLSEAAQRFELKLQYYFPDDGVDNDADIILFPHSEVSPAELATESKKYRGTHVIRDPRDLLVSAYFYHMRTEEKWCTTPNPRHKRVPSDMSYQQYLQTMDVEQGLIFELDGVSGGEIRGMHNWDYHDEDILELRFEDMVGNERDTFARIFAWYGFAGEQLNEAIDIAVGLSLRKLAADDESVKHARKGSRIGQWVDFFTPVLKQKFKQRYGQTLIELGYVQNNDW